MKTDSIPATWRDVLKAEFEAPYFKTLEKFVDEERAARTIYPPEEEVFSALIATPYEKVKVLLLGQDPYHGAGQGHGLCFSVKPGIPLPPSLKNMFKELESDLGVKAPKRNGFLLPWAEQGMLMLNAVLTVWEAHPNSHKDKGWEQFTDAIIKKVNDKTDHVVFVLWGSYAQKKAKLIDGKRHTIIKSAHPSPLSADNGFFGSKPYSTINAALTAHEQTPINWELPTK